MMYQLLMGSNIGLETIDATVFIPTFLASKHARYVPMSADWLLARAIVDLTREFAQMAGCITIGKPWTYINVGNMIDLLLCAFPAVLPVFILRGLPGIRILEMLIIFTSWVRLLEFRSLSEELAHALLPLQGMHRALLPVGLMTWIGFGAFTHAFFASDPRVESLWPGLFYQSFTTLLTASIPDEPESDNLGLMLKLTGVMVFTLGFMNLFIGVMGEKYSNAKANAKLALWHCRANSCSSYLLEARCLPCGLCSRHRAAQAAALSGMVCLAVQAYGIYTGKAIQGSFLVFLICQMIMMLACFQAPGFPWAAKCHPWSGEQQDRFFLWTAQGHVDREEHIDSELFALDQKIQHLSAKLDTGLQEMERGLQAVLTAVGQRPASKKISAQMTFGTLKSVLDDSSDL